MFGEMVENVEINKILLRGCHLKLIMVHLDYNQTFQKTKKENVTY